MSSADIYRASNGNYKENAKLGELPKKRTKPKVDIMEAFELHCSQPPIESGLGGPTAKRWRPALSVRRTISAAKSNKLIAGDCQETLVMTRKAGP